MPTLTPPVPIVLIGIHTEIGGPVAEGLGPDWETIRFIQTFSAAKSDLPPLLRGTPPPTAPTNTIGTNAYGRPVRAILLGRGFTQAQAETLFALYKDESTIPPEEGGVLWAAADEAKRAPGKAGTEPPPGAEKIMVPILKGVLEGWKRRVEAGENVGKEKGELVLY
ncbi:hypothetical protein F5Y09DRAFT_320675 [Xylaria sp. FL1042]|nr:hypothetical protein F5Y09DRAFT_320675 [Xylaria sp. FL1042]